MLTEPNIDQKIIKKTIEESYGISDASLSFLKGGEASWGYKVETKNGQKYFLKIHTGLVEYEKRFDLTFKLFNDCSIKNISHPMKNKNGGLIVFLDKYPVSLFNFISGFNASEKKLDESQRFALGKLLGQIHKAKEIIGDFQLKEDFSYGNTNRLLESINSAERFPDEVSKYKRKVAKLFKENKEKILARLHDLKDMGGKLKKEPVDFVICHGEPHQWNTMINEQGEVFLIDWDDALFAPKEKDLIMIKDDPIKLDGYRSVVGDFKLNQEVIHYYDIEWNVSEIDAWSHKIFYENLNDLQNQHDLEFFKSELEKLNNFLIPT